MKIEYMKLKSVRKVIFEVDSDDFNEFVEHHYGGVFEFVAQHEANNNSSYSFDSPFSASFCCKESEDIRSGNYKRHSVYQVFRCLSEDGLIEDGEYLITTCW